MDGPDPIFIFTDENTTMPLKDLLEWAIDKGAYLSPEIELLNFSQNNAGALFREDAKGQKVTSTSKSQIRIPENIIIRIETAISGFRKVNPEAFADIEKTSGGKQLLLKLFLARERWHATKNESFFGPYLLQLPQLDTIGSPYTWNAEQKSYLKGTNLGNSLREDLGTLVEEWWQVINQLPENIDRPAEHFVNMKFYYEFRFHNDDDLFEYFVTNEAKKYHNWTSFPSYLWAVMIIKSRSFPASLMREHVEGGDSIADNEPMLVPIVDILNHDMRANVSWFVTADQNNRAYFNFKSDSLVPGGEIYNNYGRKGNEELLLGYGFCLENNDADNVMLRIKVASSIIPQLVSEGFEEPDTSSYIRSSAELGSSQVSGGESKDLLFFVTKDFIPNNLVLLFQLLLKNKWEASLTLRMKLAGLNQLRDAIEKKLDIMPKDLPQKGDDVSRNIGIYIKSQRTILSNMIKNIKHQEKSFLDDPENRRHLFTLKDAYKKDKKFMDSLLIVLGVTSYQDILDMETQDQCWLLYILRCYNRDHFVNDQEAYLPQWIKDSFERLKKEVKITPTQTAPFKDLYLNFILKMVESVPEVYGRGTWRVEEVFIAATLLNLVGFVRGKNKETILVEPVSRS